MLLAVADQLVEAGGGPGLPAQRPVGQALVQDQVGGLVVVVHHARGLFVAGGGQLPGDILYFIGRNGVILVIDNLDIDLVSGGNGFLEGILGQGSGANKCQCSSEKES